MIRLIAFCNSQCRYCTTAIRATNPYKSMVAVDQTRLPRTVGAARPVGKSRMAQVRVFKGAGRSGHREELSFPPEVRWRSEKRIVFLFLADSRHGSVARAEQGIIRQRQDLLTYRLACQQTFLRRTSH